jgi:hypothetical protein
MVLVKSMGLRYSLGRIAPNILVLANTARAYYQYYTTPAQVKLHKCFKFAILRHGLH